MIQDLLHFNNTKPKPISNTPFNFHSKKIELKKEKFDGGFKYVKEIKEKPEKRTYLAGFEDIIDEKREKLQPKKSPYDFLGLYPEKAKKGWETSIYEKYNTKPVNERIADKLQVDAKGGPNQLTKFSSFTGGPDYNSVLKAMNVPLTGVVNLLDTSTTTATTNSTRRPSIPEPQETTTAKKDNIITSSVKDLYDTVTSAFKVKKTNQ